MCVVCSCVVCLLKNQFKVYATSPPAHRCEDDEKTRFSFHFFYCFYFSKRSFEMGPIDFCFDVCLWTLPSATRHIVIILAFLDATTAIVGLKSAHKIMSPPTHTVFWFRRRLFASQSIEVAKERERERGRRKRERERGKIWKLIVLIHRRKTLKLAFDRRLTSRSYDFLSVAVIFHFYFFASWLTFQWANTYNRTRSKWNAELFISNALFVRCVV